MTDKNDILPLGTVTDFGVIQGIHSKNGERSYFCLDDYGVVSLIPAELIGGENDRQE